MSATVLIIDDDPVSLNSIDSILQRQNFNTCKALDGLTGLDLVHEISPDLILSDTRVPKRDGFAVLAELRRSESTSRIPVILLSEKAADRDIRTALELGADHYLMKPLTSDGLLKAVTACLEKYERLEKRALMQQQYIESLEQQVQKQRDLIEVQTSLLQKVAQDLRHPISNINLAVQMMGSLADGTAHAQEFELLEDECIRVIALLNEVSNCQELLLSSRINVLQRLLLASR